MALRLFTAASIAALMAGSAQAEMVLHVLHTNDLHNRIEPINKYDSTCDQETQDAGECFGGVARVAAKVRELRDKITSEGGNVDANLDDEHTTDDPPSSSDKMSPSSVAAAAEALL